MHKTILSLLLALCATSASAQSCPDRYRFVDFGLEDQSGTLRRGGTIFRAFDPANTHLLLSAGTTCLDVKDLAIDGRALKIPVVSAISVDPKASQIAFSVLQLKSAEDVAVVAEQNATRHRRNLAKSGARTTRGENFLCAHDADAQSLSCQVASPYRQKAALIVFCDANHCEMPVLGLHKSLYVAAKWDWDGSTDETAGAEISAKIHSIKDFLANHIQGLKLS